MTASPERQQTRQAEAGDTKSSPGLQHSHLSDSPLPQPEEKVCVVGLGYIGLPTAGLLTSRGYAVHGVDVRQEVVDAINGGNIHIQEPDLDVVVQSSVGSGRLKADCRPAPADVFILSVPTPLKNGNEPDLGCVEAAARGIAEVVKRGDLIILESTSPVGTTEMVAAWLAEERPDLTKGGAANGNNPCPDLLIAHCPERVLPGQIVRELVENDRIVGGLDEASTKAAAAFYRAFVSGKVRETDARTAEMSKLAENTFRDINIAYANELSMICDRQGIDVWELIDLANNHPRVSILQPGPGVGGHCIAVDPWFIVSQDPEQARLIRTAREVNNLKPHYVCNQIKSRLAERKVVACLGLAFKPDVDDLRESPALMIAETLAVDSSIQLLLVEPHISQLPASFSNQDNVRFVTLEEAVERADVTAILVRHTEFCENQAEIGRSGADILDFVSALSQRPGRGGTEAL